MADTEHNNQINLAPERPPHGGKRLAKRDLSPAALLARLRALLARLLHRIRRIIPRARTIRSEQREGRFPESNRSPVQLVLLLAGLLPMWSSRIRERIFRRRGAQIRFSSAIAEFTPRRRRIHPLVFVGAALLFAAVGAFFSLYTPATTVSYRGEPVETVRDGAAAQAIAARVEDLTVQTLGKSFSLGEDAIQYSTGFVRRSELGEIGELEKKLTDEIGLVTYGYSLYIDDTLIGSTPYKGALEALLDQVKRANSSEDTLEVNFVEVPVVTEGYLPTESLVNLGHIAEIVNSSKAGEVTYTVVAGDTWSRIASRNGMTNDELLALNPGFDINKLNIGDELVLSREVPYLTVRVTERQNYVESVDFEVIYRDDASMYQGDTRTIERGEYGTADVVADVVYVNGIETERTVISQVMLTEPKTETRARGTKERPSWLPTGSFRWPCSGRITSSFGYRNTGIRGASTYHQGIDIACAYGTTIVAADGGTVEYTGYKGAMGYTVIIDHGNGYKTYYEHCSSFACRTGQHVYKGQAIAYVGTSGVASGAHCHFGIQKNGVYVNPMNYLR